MIKKFDFNNSYDGFFNLKKLIEYSYYEKAYPGLKDEMELKIQELIEKENIDSCKEFISTCVKENGFYKFFGIHEKTACMYGKKKEDIVRVKMVKSENQEKNYKEDACWGFYVTPRKRPTVEY